MHRKFGKFLNKNILIVLLSLGTLPSVFAQSIVYGDPTAFDSTFNDNSEVISPILSNDGNTLFFVKAFNEENVGGMFAGSDIWISERDSLGNWSTPSNKNSKWNNQDNNAVVGVKEDEEIVYLLNSYKKGSGISFSKKINGKWSTPDFIQIPGVGNNTFVGFYMAKSFDVLLISMDGPKSFGQEDLYVSVKDSTNKWSRPVNLGATINTTGYEISPFLSEDKTTLYFASDGHGGEGGADIFMTRRLYDGWTVWSKPRNMGNSINSDGFDAYFSIYSDSVAYLSSNRNSDVANIYSLEVSKEEEAISLEEMETIVDSSYRPDLLNFEAGPSIVLYFDPRSYEHTEENLEKIENYLENSMGQGNTHFHISGSGDGGLQAGANRNLANWRIFATMSKLLSNEVRADGISGERLQVSRANPEMFGVIRIQSYKEL